MGGRQGGEASGGEGGRRGGDSREAGTVEERKDGVEKGEMGRGESDRRKGGED